MLIRNAREMGVNPMKRAFVGNDIKRAVPAAKRAGMLPILVVNWSYDMSSLDEGVSVVHELNELLVLS